MTEEKQNKKGLPKIAWVVIGLFAFIVMVVSVGSDDMDKSQEEFFVAGTEEIMEKEEGTKEDLLLGSEIIEEDITLDVRPAVETLDIKQNDKEEIKIEPKIEDEKVPSVNSNCIEVNTASRTDLMKIIHIDEARVDDLISKRPFRSVDNLTRITGIGAVRLEEIKEQGLACVN